MTNVSSQPTKPPMHSTGELSKEEVGDGFLRALTERDFVRLASCFNADARFRALLPRGLREAAGAEELTRSFQGWFGSADRIEVLDARTDSLGDRQHLVWRFRVHDGAGRRLIEQQAYATIRAGGIAELDLLCSGFRPEHSPQAADVEERSTPREVAAVLDGGDANCATLTPLIKARLGELHSGEVLEIISSEPSAEADISSWSNLTGNALVATRDDGAHKRFHVRKK